MLFRDLFVFDRCIHPGRIHDGVTVPFIPVNPVGGRYIVHFGLITAQEFIENTALARIVNAVEHNFRFSILHLVIQGVNALKFPVNYSIIRIRPCYGKKSFPLGCKLCLIIFQNGIFHNAPSRYNNHSANFNFCKPALSS